MRLDNKQKIAATARQLIRMLEECDDSEFVDLVLDCVASADAYPLRVENTWWNS